MPKTLPEIFEEYAVKPNDTIFGLILEICVDAFWIDWLDRLILLTSVTVADFYRDAIAAIGPGEDAEGRTGAEILDLIARSLTSGEPMPITDLTLASAVANFSQSIHASK